MANPAPTSAAPSKLDAPMNISDAVFSPVADLTPTSSRGADAAAAILTDSGAPSDIASSSGANYSATTTSEQTTTTSTTSHPTTSDTTTSGCFIASSLTASHVTPLSFPPLEGSPIHRDQASAFSSPSSPALRRLSRSEGIVRYSSHCSLSSDARAARFRSECRAGSVDVAYACCGIGVRLCSRDAPIDEADTSTSSIQSSSRAEFFIAPSAHAESATFSFENQPTARQSSGVEMNAGSEPVSQAVSQFTSPSVSHTALQASSQTTSESTFVNKTNLGIPNLDSASDSSFSSPERSPSPAPISGADDPFLTTPSSDAAPSSTAFDFERESGAVHVVAPMIFDGVCVKWVGFLDLKKMEGRGRMVFDEEGARRMTEEEEVKRKKIRIGGD